jgi:multidrug resistance efflux pump
MKSRFVTVLIVLLGFLGATTPQATAKDCDTLANAVSAAEGTVAGLMASVSSANSAVAAAKSKLNSARLPAQRVSAQVTLLREQQSASQAKSALNAARNVLRSARVSLSQCK